MLKIISLALRLAMAKDVADPVEYECRLAAVDFDADECEGLGERLASMEFHPLFLDAGPITWTDSDSNPCERF